MSAVADIEDITSAWLSQALERPVELLEVDRIGTGQTAAAYRLRLRAEGLPDTLVAKVAAGDEEARKRVGYGVSCEVAFYADLQQTVSVRSPRCWYVAATEDATRFTLLLEDLAPRVPGVQVDGLSAERAIAAVTNLAGLHAPRWNDETLFEQPMLTRTDAGIADFLGQTTEAAAAVFLDRYRDDLSDEDVDTLGRAAESIGPWLVARPEPFALLHGDYRLDNLMFGDEGDVVAVDWQTLMVGLPTRDVAYLLGTCLDVDARRSAERDLVQAYHRALLTHGVTGYDEDRCFEDYRLGQLQGPMITMLGAAYATAERTAEADAMFLAMARRSAAAIRDLGSLDLVRAA